MEAGKERRVNVSILHKTDRSDLGLDHSGSGQSGPQAGERQQEARAVGRMKAQTRTMVIQMD